MVSRFGLDGGTLVCVRSDLTEAIDGLYEVFERYPRTSFDGCFCCWGGTPGAVPLPDNDTQSVVRVPPPGGTRPLRELTADDLSDVAAEVPLTAGTFDVLRHYLPRILELAAADAFDWPDLEILIGHLAYDDEGGDAVPWLEWSADEQGAIRRYLHALWHERLEEADDEWADPVDSTLTAVALIEPSITWYLDEWLTFRAPSYAVNLERWLQANLNYLRRARLRNAFWDREEALAATNADAVVEWARSTSTLDAVRRAADRARTSAERDALEECYLRWLPSTKA
jgi:hypothetical protein